MQGDPKAVNMMTNTPYGYNHGFVREAVVKYSNPMEDPPKHTMMDDMEETRKLIKDLQLKVRSHQGPGTQG